MPVVDFVLLILMLAVVIGLGCVFVALYGGIAVAIIGICFLTGWFPILICATDASYSITWAAQSRDSFGTIFVQRWAYISMLIYVGMGLLTVIVSFVRPDPDGLPPGLKFLALFSVPDAVSASAQARSPDGHGLFDTGFFDKVKTYPRSAYRARMDARAMEREAKAAQEEVEIARHRARQAEDIADAHEELERLRAKEKALKEYVKNNE